MGKWPFIIYIPLSGSNLELAHREQKLLLIIRVLERAPAFAQSVDLCVGSEWLMSVFCLPLSLSISLARSLSHLSLCVVIRSSLSSSDNSVIFVGAIFASPLSRIENIIDNV